MKLTTLLPERKFVPKQSEMAFTLIEALFALSIFSLIVLFITPMFQIIISGLNTPNMLSEMEWEVFSSQIKREIRTGSNLEIVSGRILLTVDSDTVMYEKFGSNIRRRVNFTGNEIILQNISEHYFTLLNNGVKITVKDLRGNEYSVAAYSPIKWKSSP